MPRTVTITGISTMITGVAATAVALAAADQLQQYT